MLNFRPEVEATIDATARLLFEWIIAGGTREEREARFFALRYEGDHESVFMEIANEASQMRADAVDRAAAADELRIFASPPTEPHDALFRRGIVSARVVGHLLDSQTGRGLRWYEPGEEAVAPPPGSHAHSD